MDYIRIPESELDVMQVVCYSKYTGRVVCIIYLKVVYTMAGISKVLETELNGLKVNLFEFDIENEESFNEIKAYLVNKVKISKVHNIEEYDLTYYGTKNLNPDFVARFNEQVAKINIPKKTKIPQFDVRRELLTDAVFDRITQSHNRIFGACSNFLY